MKPYYEDKWTKIFLGDCRDILPQLDVKVDLVLTDPPYGMGECFLLRGADRNAHIENRNIASWDKSFEITEYPFLITLPVVAFTTDWGIPSWYKIHPNGRVLAWVKTNPTPSFRKALVNAAEWIFADAVFTYREHSNSQTALFGAYETTPNRLHPTQKPEWIILQLLQMFNSDLILDPFLGSGTTCYCAKKLNRYSIGIEIEEKYCEIAAKRCSQETMVLDIPQENISAEEINLELPL
jgi:site-specific DNA-methyltransferase (adenine-specific)